MTARTAILEKMEKLGLSIESTFVPWSQSRNKNEKDRTLNWAVSLKKGDQVIIKVDYSAGIGHCPSYRQGDKSIHHDDSIIFETENGCRSGDPCRKKIIPDAASVMASLCVDASAIDAGSFEDWASDLGFDADSRKAEKMYRACVDIGLKLRAALGDEDLAAMRAVASEL